MNFLPDDDPRKAVWEACESPLEQFMCTGISLLLGCKAVTGDYDQSRRAELAELAGDKPAAFLFSQQPIGRYRADFLIVLIDPAERMSRRFVIECDGKNFHTSDEQIEYDRKRDAAIVATGVRFVARYSGREMHRDFQSVTDRVARWLAAFGVPIVEDEWAGFYRHFVPRFREIAEERKRERARIWEAEAMEELVRHIQTHEAI